MELIIKKIKTIYGSLFVLSTLLPIISFNKYYSPSLASFISFKDNSMGEEYGLLGLALIVAGVIFIVVDSCPAVFKIKEESKPKWLKAAKWIAIIAVVVVVVMLSSISPRGRFEFLSHTGFGFWLMIIAFFALVFEKKIVTTLEEKIDKAKESEKPTDTEK